MAIEEKGMASKAEKPSIEAGTYKEDFYKSVPPESNGGSGFVVYKTPTASVGWWRGIASLHGRRYLLPVALLGLILLALLAACAQTQQAQDPAGTSTQNPPISQLIQATHGILDTTGTVPQSFLDQLRT